MSKGNLFLGFARGKVGDVVFSHTNGEQVTRARNRSPKNPQTPLQLLQRVVMKTSSTAYSLMQAIADHSFQGYAEGTANQSRFTKRNVDLLRSQLAEEINSGDPDVIISSTKANFASKNSAGAEFNAYLVSEGTIAPVPVIFSQVFYALMNFGDLTGKTQENITYQDVVNGFGIQRGDQLTFLMLSVDDTEAGMAGYFNSFQFARVILDPSDGDMTSTFFNGTAINKPNERNEGNVELAFSNTQGSTPRMLFSSPTMNSAGGSASEMAAGTVIVSRENGGQWLRSTQRLVLRPSDISIAGHLTYDHEIDFLGDAILSYMNEANSSLYLNQAGF